MITLALYIMAVGVLSLSISLALLIVELKKAGVLK